MLLLRARKPWEMMELQKNYWCGIDAIFGSAMCHGPPRRCSIPACRIATWHMGGLEENMRLRCCLICSCTSRSTTVTNMFTNRLFVSHVVITFWLFDRILMIGFEATKISYEKMRVSSTCWPVLSWHWIW